MKILSSTIMKVIGAVVLVGLIAGGLFLAIPSGSVFAQSSTPTQTPAQQSNTAKLEQNYQKALKALDTQSTNLGKVEALVPKAQDRIAKLQANGKDVTILQDALKDFEAHLAAAKQEHQTAADILNAHNGFDAQGKVTDATLAKQTLLTAAAHMKDARLEMRPGIREVRQAIRQFIRDNRKK